MINACFHGISKINRLNYKGVEDFYYMKENAKKVRKKVLLVATEPAPGMIPFATKIIDILQRNPAFDVFTITVGFECRFNSEYAVWDKKHMVYIPYPEKKYLRLLYKFWPRKVIKNIQSMHYEQNFEIVHFLTGDFSMALYMLSHADDKRFFYTVHDLIPHERVFHLNRYFIFKYIDWGNRIMRKMIPNLVTSSKEQVEILKKLYPGKKIHFAHFPSLVTKTMKTGTEKVEELEGKQSYILFFGTVNHYKGVDLLIDAFRNSCVYQRTYLVIAGRGEFGVIDDERIIRINRFVKDEEIKSLFVNSCFVVYPYRSVTMSGVLSIAFYFRKIVVLSDLPFFKSYNNDNTFFFKNNDVEDLCNKMEQVYINRDLTVSLDTYSYSYSDKLLENDYSQIYTKHFAL